MAIGNYETRPPAVRAVQFTGSNADEIAELAGSSVPPIKSDASGPYIEVDLPNWWGGSTITRISLSGWLTESFGSKQVLDDPSFRVQYRAAIA